jgi:hypothetical protein
MMSVLGVIAAELNKIDVPYEYMEWTSDVQYPYFVGEYSEITGMTEDGYKESTLLLTGTHRGSWLELEQMKVRIENHFPNIHGLRLSTDDGAAIVYYGNSFPVRTGEADLKRIQINLNVKEWRNHQ